RVFRFALRAEGGLVVRGGVEAADEEPADAGAGAALVDRLLRRVRRLRWPLLDTLGERHRRDQLLELLPDGADAGLAGRERVAERVEGGSPDPRVEENRALDDVPLERGQGSVVDRLLVRPPGDLDLLRLEPFVVEERVDRRRRVEPLPARLVQPRGRARVEV